MGDIQAYILSVSHGFRAIETHFYSYRFDFFDETVSSLEGSHLESEPTNFPAIQIDTRICGSGTRLS